MDEETEKYVIDGLEKIDAALDRIGEGLDKIGDMERAIDEDIEKLRAERDEFNLQMLYLKKRDIGRPFGMDFHDCEMTYQ